MKYQFEHYEFEQVKTPETGESQNTPPEKVATLADLLDEFSEPPVPIEPPPTDLEAENQTDPESETPAKTPGNAPLSHSNGTGNTRASKMQQDSANLLMKGWNSLFAGIAVYLTGNGDKYEFYKASDRDVKELSELLAEMQAAYNINIAPWIPFTVGFTGLYGAKTFEIISDMKAKKKTPDQIRAELAEIKMRSEIADLKKQQQPTNHKRGRGRPKKL